MVSSYSLPFTIQPSDDILLFILNNIWLSLSQGFCHSSVGKESACNAGDLSLIPELGRFPGGGPGYPFQYSYLENFHGQRSLAGRSPWGHKELDMTKHKPHQSGFGERNGLGCNRKHLLMLRGIVRSGEIFGVQNLPWGSQKSTNSLQLVA